MSLNMHSSIPSDSVLTLHSTSLFPHSLGVLCFLSKCPQNTNQGNTHLKQNTDQNVPTDLTSLPTATKTSLITHKQNNTAVNYFGSRDADVN